MSIYFNFQIEGDRFEDVDANDTILLGSGSIVDEQQAYQVGVCRFKIPLTKIPLFRIYAEEYLTTMGFRGAYDWLPAGTGFKALQWSRTAFMGGQHIYCENVEGQSYGRYGYDIDYNKKNRATVSTVRRDRIYIDIYSHDEFVDMLNRAWCKSFQYNINELATGTVQNTYTLNVAASTVLGSGTLNDGMTSLGSITVPHRPSTLTGFAGEIISGIKLNVKKFTSTLPGSPIDFSSFNFFLQQKNNAGTVLKTWFFNKNILRGLTDFDGTVAGEVKKQITFALEVGADILAQDCYDSTLYDKYSNVAGLASPFLLVPNATDFTGVIGQRADDPTVAQNYTYNLMCHNTSYQNGGNGRSATIGVLGEITLTMETMVLASIPTTVELQDISYGSTETLIPQFKWDSDKEKIFLSRNNIWDSWFGTEFYMNQALANLLSFERYKTIDIKSKADIESVLGTSAYRDGSEVGGIYTFPLLIEKLDAGSDVNGRELNEWDEFYETFKSTFARDMLDSIIITSGTIATQGEIVGNGKTTRKVITDFKLDPAATARDYLLYQPSGAIRYYPLQSTQPLRIVDIKIEWQDIKGILRQLIVPPLQTCSVKLEFRPNNMIHYY